VSVLSKLLENLVARQLVSHLNAVRLLPDLQSAYRANHSTETAVRKALSDNLTALDTGDIGMLTLLDLSSAFDTVDHDILLRRLAVSYDLGGTVLVGFSRTSTAAYSSSAAVDQPRPRLSLSSESHRAQFLDRSSFYCILRTC